MTSAPGDTPVVWTQDAVDTLLQKASQEDWESVTTALAAGFDPREPSSEYGLSLLHFTTNHSNVELTREALARGASPNALCMFMSSPVEYAVRSGPVEILQMLLDAGGDVNSRYRSSGSCCPLQSLVYMVGPDRPWKPDLSLRLRLLLGHPDIHVTLDSSGPAIVDLAMERGWTEAADLISDEINMRVRWSTARGAWVAAVAYAALRRGSL